MTGRIWRTFRGAVVLVLVASAGVLLILVVVGRGIDAHQKDKEIRLVELRLAGAKRAMTTDLTAATVWDEAVVRLSDPFDVDWSDHHLGPFFAAQSGHVATVAYDGAGRPARFSKDGAVGGGEAGASYVVAAAPLVAEVRREAARRDRDAVALAAVRLRSGVVSVEGRVYQLGVSSVVRHTDGGDVPAADPVVASFKPLEAAVAPLGEELGVRSPVFLRGTDSGLTGRGGAGQAILPVRDPSGAVLGHIRWQPETPGARILARAFPTIMVLIVAMVLAALLLFQRIAADVGRLAQSEAALASALSRAEAGSAAKSRFLANISHELRTPLNGVLGMAEVLERDLLTPQQRDRMAILKASGRVQLRLIENLLLVTRLQSDAVTITKTEFSPTAMLERLAATWEAAAVEKGLTVAIVSEVGRWAGDAAHIERLLDVLIDNAVRVTETGEVALSATRSRQRLILTVRDTGPGLDPAMAERLLCPRNGDMPPVDGAGLGLTIATRLTAMMGGDISVDTGPGRGAAFRVSLP